MFFDEGSAGSSDGISRTPDTAASTRISSPGSVSGNEGELSQDQLMKILTEGWNEAGEGRASKLLRFFAGEEAGPKVDAYAFAINKTMNNGTPDATTREQMIANWLQSGTTREEVQDFIRYHPVLTSEARKELMAAAETLPQIEADSSGQGEEKPEDQAERLRKGEELETLARQGENIIETSVPPEQQEQLKGMLQRIRVRIGDIFGKHTTGREVAGVTWKALYMSLLALIVLFSMYSNLISKIPMGGKK